MHPLEDRILLDMQAVIRLGGSDASRGQRSSLMRSMFVAHKNDLETMYKVEHARIER